MIDVVAAYIEQDNKILLFQRPTHKARGLQWEFPGGKIEPGETPSQALIRECQEELDITVSVVEELARTVHGYPDITIDLTLLRCQIEWGTPKLREHIAMAKVSRAEALLLDLAPADRKLLEKVSF